MTIFTSALHPLFVGEISGLDLRTPVDQATFREIAQALDRYAVLVFRGQPLSDDHQIAFSRLLGPIEMR
jgi:alpha-ketoglutarate-dependent 2,4-dichlorophenoxyacetate dioxygenase